MVLKKKWPALLLIVCLVVCLAACSGNPEPAPEEGAAVAQSEPEESAAAEEGAEETRHCLKMRPAFMKLIRRQILWRLRSC